MRILAWLACVLVAVILLLGGLLWGGTLLIAESGVEIAELRTTDASGATFETRLWVVDDSGFSWLWAAAPGRRWLERLRTQPEVRLVRGGEAPWGKDLRVFGPCPWRPDEASWPGGSSPIRPKQQARPSPGPWPEPPLRENASESPGTVP